MIPEDDFYDDEREPDEWEIAMGNCGQHWYKDTLYCTMLGTEHCDWECPFTRDIGKTRTEFDEEFDTDESEMD